MGNAVHGGLLINGTYSDGYSLLCISGMWHDLYAQHKIGATATVELEGGAKHGIEPKMAMMSSTKPKGGAKFSVESRGGVISMKKLDGGAKHAREVMTTVRVWVRVKVS